MADSPKASEATSSDGESIEYLATARARRSTAGKHMSSLLDAEADDELALLFAEDEEDEEFTFGEDNVAEGGEGAATEDAEDMELDSSSDEEDQGPAAQEDELEGEKELEKQAKAERLKKRKAQDPMRLTTLRKKVKIDSNLPSRSMTIPAPRPRKKSERISWLPAVEDGPTRASSRKQTVQNKQLTHERLKDSEKRRLRLIATMEEAAKRKESTKAKQLTQEDRLAEAAKTERINSKSLNRWEEMEKKRSEEQRLRLEALQNRRLDGPVVTWWSGVARWINDKLTQVGIRSYTQAAEKEAGRRKKSKDVPPSSDQGLKAGESKTLEPPGDNNLTVKEAPPDTAALTTVDQQQPTEHSIKEQRKAVLDEGASFLDEIQLYASMPEEASSGPMEQSADAQTVKTSSVEITTVQSTSKKPTDPQPSDESASLSQAQISSQTPSQPHPTHIQPNTDISNPSAVQNPAPAPSSTYTQSPLVWAPITSSHPPADNLNSQPTHTAPDQPALGPPAPPKVETSSRNCVILQDFESTTLQERSDYSILFNPRKPQKLQS